MNFDSARELVKGYLGEYGVTETQGLNDSGFGGVQLGELEVYFHFGATLEATSAIAMRATPPEPEKALIASARIYTFKNEPDQNLMDELQREAEKADESKDAALEYMPENKGLFLSRQYSREVPADRFKDEVDDLLVASRFWLERRLEDCMERARNR